MDKMIDYKKYVKAEEEIIPQKLARFEEFTELMRSLALQGTEKYTGAEADKKETIDLIPDILGEHGYVSFVLGDLVKRVVRFKNQRRERDLVKIALWTYLLWMRLFPKQEKGEDDECLPGRIPKRI
jgi:hypothetical protein